MESVYAISLTMVISVNILLAQTIALMLDYVSRVNAYALLVEQDSIVQ